MSLVARVADPSNLLQVVQLGTAFLRRHGIEKPRLEAEVIIAHILQINRIDLYVQYERPCSQSERASMRLALQRRAQGIPSAYVTGHREFYGLDFEVGPDVLIPRPETETLVAWVLKEVTSAFAPTIRPLELWDAGTGSGCVVAALTANDQGFRGIGVDVSPGAVKIAQRNILALGLEDRATIHEGVWVDAAAPGSIHVLVSNPPYISTSELANLSREVGQEPVLALDGGADGLDAYRHLFASAKSKLARPAIGAVEVDELRAGDVERLVVAHWPEAVTTIINDLVERPRVVGWRVG